MAIFQRGKENCTLIQPGKFIPERAFRAFWSRFIPLQLSRLLFFSSCGNHKAAGGIVIVLISGFFNEKRVKGHGRRFTGYSGGQMYMPPGLSALFCCLIAKVEDGKTGGVWGERGYWR